LRIVVVTAALSAAATGVPATAAAAKCPTSKSKGVTVVMRSSEAIVYHRQLRSSRYPSLGVQRIHFGCHRAVGKPRRLNGWTDFDKHIGNWALSGRYVAFSYWVEEGASDSATPSIVRYDLRTGRGGAAGDVIDADEPGWQIHAIVLKRNASLAWIASFYEGSDAHNSYQVHKVERDLGYAQSKVDEGDAIAPSSLALSADRRTVRWANQGTARSTPLR
jgi:hypothetical protein